MSYTKEQLDQKCVACGCKYGDHYTTNDRDFLGCIGDCGYCEGFSCDAKGCPDCDSDEGDGYNSIEERVTCIICGKAFCDDH